MWTKIESPDDFPIGPFWLVVVFGEKSVWIPGDERSRTHPGHGYPERTETFPDTKLYSAPNESELMIILRRLYEEDRDRQDLAVLKVEGKSIVRVSLGIAVE